MNIPENIPENENKPESSAQNEPILEEEPSAPQESPAENAKDADDDEFSTVFSNPTAHKKSSGDVKRKKLLPIILSSVLAVAILISGTVAVIKLIPEKEEEESGTEIKDIDVLSLNSDDFKSVTVSNSNGKFELYSVKTESETDSSAPATVDWYVKGYKDGDILNSGSVAGIADNVAQISASREVTEKTTADCGLEKPSVKADVVTDEDKKFSVLLGNESPDKSGYYLKVSDSDKIYVVGSDVKESLDFTLLSLANTDMLPAVPTDDVDSAYKNDEGSITSCDKLTLTGKNFPEPLILVPNDDEQLSTLAAYKTISPTKRIADNIDGIFTIFQSGLSVTGAYALDCSQSTLKSLGLTSPDLTAVMQIGKQTHTFKFALQPDGAYAVICDGSKIVKKAEASALPFIDYKASDYYSEWICLISIDNIKELTLKVGDKSYTFGIVANEDEESDDSYIVTYNGKTIKSSPFQEFYQDCISIVCSEFTVDKVSGNPDYEIIFTFNDDIGVKQTARFIKYSETKYQAYMNGEALGKVTASSLKALENSLKDLIGE